jgi:4-carboxymuconolactone decarboxylase
MPRKRVKPAKVQPPRLIDIPEGQLTPPQRTFREAIMASRKLPGLRGPFAIWIHRPGYGNLVQTLGAHCRFGSGIVPRLSEFSILAIAQIWRAQFEWFAHAPIAEKAGVAPQTIKDLQAGRVPKKAAKDERAIYDFVAELHRTKRVSDKTYARVHAFLGDAGMVEFTGILGYYTLVSMTLNTFRVPLPSGEALPFRESA